MLFQKEVSTMCKSIFILLVLITFSFAESIRVDPVHAESSTDSEYLQYDDGAINWLTWGGTYRGVWFNTDDFVPGMSGFLLDFSEYWMYHHSSHPWDTSDFYAEVWNGGDVGPVELLDRTLVTAAHFTGIIVYYPPLLAETDFWALENTELSSGGWPAIIGDSGSSGTAHSFLSDNFILWEPWGNSDMFIRCGGEFPTALENSTWAGIKTVFF